MDLLARVAFSACDDFCLRADAAAVTASAVSSVTPAGLTRTEAGQQVLNTFRTGQMALAIRSPAQRHGIRAVHRCRSQHAIRKGVSQLSLTE